jgi:uncharacterized protein YlzI (FlbEa/FlbD family)
VADGVADFSDGGLTMGRGRLGLVRFELGGGRAMYVEASTVDRVEEGADGVAAIYLSDGEFFVVDGRAEDVAARVNALIDGDGPDGDEP